MKDAGGKTEDPPETVFLLAEAKEDLVIEAAGEDLLNRAEGTFFRRSLHPHLKRNKGEAR